MDISRLTIARSSAIASGDDESANAHSTVSLSLDKCLVVENWDGGRGHSGQNVFGYSADDKSWYPKRLFLRLL